MKRVLLDHCVPRQFGNLLTGHTVATTARLGWAALSNGELLAMAEAAGFTVFITSDKNLRYQQNLAGRSIAIIELPTNRLRIVRNYEASVRALLDTIAPGAYEVVS